MSWYQAVDVVMIACASLSALSIVSIATSAACVARVYCAREKTVRQYPPPRVSSRDGSTWVWS